MERAPEIDDDQTLESLIPPGLRSNHRSRSARGSGTSRRAQQQRAPQQHQRQQQRQQQQQQQQSMPASSSAAGSEGTGSHPAGSGLPGQRQPQPPQPQQAQQDPHHQSQQQDPGQRRAPQAPKAPPPQAPQAQADTAAVAAVTDTHYQVLDVQPTATKEEIKKAYRQLVKPHHPDKGGNPLMFLRLTEAYEVLSDDTRRSDYDNELQNVVSDVFLRFSDDDGNVWVSEQLLIKEEEQNRKHLLNLQDDQAKITMDEVWAHEEAVRVLEDKISRQRADYEDQIATLEKSLEEVTQEKNLGDLRAQYSQLQAQQLSQNRQNQQQQQHQLALHEELRQQTAAAQQLHAKHDALQQQLQEERDKHAAERAAAQELQDTADHLQNQQQQLQQLAAEAQQLALQEELQQQTAAAAQQLHAQLQEERDKHAAERAAAQELQDRLHKLQNELHTAYDVVIKQRKNRKYLAAAAATAAAAAQEFQDLQDKHALLQQQLQESQSQASLSEQLHVLDQQKHEQQVRATIAATDAQQQLQARYDQLRSDYDLLQEENTQLKFEAQAAEAVRPKLPKLCPPPARPTGTAPKWFPPKPPAPAPTT